MRAGAAIGARGQGRWPTRLLESHDMDLTTTHADHAPTPTTEDAAEATTKPPRTVTIREAAELAGTTRDAIRGRVERGSLQSVLGRDGARRIPVSELRRAGLLDHGDNHADAHVGTHGMVDVEGTTHGVAAVADLVAVVRELHTENVAAVARAVAAETRLQLEQRAASTVEEELHATRVQVAALEQELRDAEAELARAIAERDERAADARRRTWFGISRRRASSGDRALQDAGPAA